MSIIQCLTVGNYIMVNKTLIKQIGLVEAVILGELCGEYEHWRKEDKLEDNMFYSTIENIEENTGLSEYKQRNAIKNLEKLGIIESEIKGVPAKKYFRINENQLLNYLEPSPEKIKGLGAEKLRSNNNKNNNTEKSSIPKDIDDYRFLKNTGKPKKNNLYQKCIALINAKTDDERLRKSLVNYLEFLLESYRDQNKQLYANVFKGKLNMLDQFDESDWLDIVTQSLQKGWLAFYSIKTYSSPNRREVNVARDIEHSPIDHIPHVSDDPDYERKQAEFIEKCKKNGWQYEF